MGLRGYLLLEILVARTGRPGFPIRSCGMVILVHLDLLDRYRFRRRLFDLLYVVGVDRLLAVPRPRSWLATWR